MCRLGQWQSSQTKNRNNLSTLSKNNVSVFGIHAKGTHFTESPENRKFACQNAVK